MNVNYKTYRLGTLLVIGVLMLLVTSCRSTKRPKSESIAEQHELVVKHKDPEPIIEKSENTPIGDATLKYIKTFGTIAKEEMRKYKIPASITLAQGILESSSGRSELTRQSNNHFGIKCHKGWDGRKVYHDDDRRGECFRAYDNPATSFRDHSLFLVNRDRYKSLFQLKQGDYIAWARGLSRAGYATDRRYPAKLIALIEKYQLDKFDEEVSGKKFKPTKNNWTSRYTVKKGDTLYSISKSFGLSVTELKRLNNLASNTISIGQELRVSK
jgi:flagellum-specific peptidoglycan hydrolase FlgJ